MISTTKGAYCLSAGSEDLNGDYTYEDGTLYSVDGSTKAPVGTFCYDPISRTSLPADQGGLAEIKVIQICNSEIMKEIQKPSSSGAYFVLPSQLNGAEYPSHRSVVRGVEDYKFDNTGGPRGQLAVHPAPGQFVLDNAACDGRPGGINAVDAVLAEVNKAGFAFELVNGYLKIDPNGNATALSVFKDNLHTLRPLVMLDAPACGLTPDKRSFSAAKHAVNLVYASAVPVDTYLNRGNSAFQVQIAESVLTAQYYGALKFAADKCSSGKAKVFLMPLGGGVFNNPWSSIAMGMSKAVEMLAPAELAKLDISVLTWEGNARERLTTCEELNKLKKLAE